MKTRWYVLVGSLIILFVLVIANMAHADTVISSQTDASGGPWYGPNSGWMLGAFTSGAGSVTGIDLIWSSTDGTTKVMAMSIMCYTDSAGTIPCAGWSSASTSTNTVTYTPTPAVVHFIFASPSVSTGEYLFQYTFFPIYTDLRQSVNASHSLIYYVASGGGGGGVPTDDTSRIISVTPSGGATTSPVALSMQYYSSATSSIPLDTVSLDLRSIEGGGVSTLELSSTAATGTITTWSASSSATLPDGLYTAFWSLSSSESILYHIATSTSFIVGTSTWQELISLASTTPSATCSIFDIGGCMQSVIAWAFVPSTQSQELLAQSGSALLHAPPLGYYYTYRDTIRIAFSTTTIDEVMATSTRSALISIIDPMRTGAIAVFWAGWLVAQYAFFMRFILPLV